MFSTLTSTASGGETPTECRPCAYRCVKRATSAESAEDADADLALPCSEELFLRPRNSFDDPRPKHLDVAIDHRSAVFQAIQERPVENRYVT